jgi:organic radical activating enzyme
MHDLQEVQFYINNDCNLACKNCVSYNNFDFKGYYLWKDSEKKNQQWPRFINPGRISILGGEPYLNPDLMSWVRGIRSLWPDHDYITVATNGTLLDRSKIKQHTKEIIKLGIQIEISIHDPKQHEKIERDFLRILDEESIEYEIVDIWDDYTSRFDKKRIIDRRNNKVLGTTQSAYYFENISIESQDETVIRFYSSNAERAHSNCLSRECHYIIHGDLYKCVLVSTAKEFSKQFSLDPGSQRLLDMYQPCDPLRDDNEIFDFLDSIKNHIPQCSLCPTQRTRESAL